ncbi:MULTISPECIES: hypothetical protein [Paraliobacillus]|uniref:prenylated flavin chaperone LpdD n=1 Tax=Paraliobacillus TaxID=200903 RepID=UPI000DD3597E|nr:MULTISPECIES: hypothetical protein [Paraliobacillus]
MIHKEKSQGEIHVELDAYFMGEDLVLLISGGDQPHLGTITAGARLEPIQTIQLQNHKEFYITEELAVLLRKKFAGNFAICSGVHIDNIKKEEIQLLSHLCIDLGKELIHDLEKASL